LPARRVKNGKLGGYLGLRTIDMRDTDRRQRAVIPIAGRGILPLFADAGMHQRRSCSIKNSQARPTRVEIKGDSKMWPGFNIVMRIVSSLIGVVMILMGGVWILQGLNLAFRRGFMVGNFHWTIYGAILALVGVAQVLWSNTRQTKT
jgi:hypothetical protein